MRPWLLLVPALAGLLFAVSPAAALSSIDIAWDIGDVPSVVEAGTTTSVRVLLESSGEVNTSGRGKARAGYDWYGGACPAPGKAVLRGEREPFASRISHVGSAALDFDLQAPADPGSYCLVWSTDGSTGLLARPLARDVAVVDHFTRQTSSIRTDIWAEDAASTLTTPVSPSAQTVPDGGTSDTGNIEVVEAAVVGLTLNARSYGAVPNDGQSDATAIFKAVAAAYAAGGGNVYLPAGIYDLGNKITMRPNVVLGGDGPSTILKKMPAMNTEAINIVYNDAGVRDLAIDANHRAGAGGVGIWATGNRIHLTNVTITDVAGHAVSVANGADIVIDGVTATDIDGNGLNARNTLRLAVRNSTFTNIPHGSGIYVYAEPRMVLDIEITGNTVDNVGNNETDGARENGISIWKVNKGLIDGNTVTHAQMGGIRINHGAQFTVSNNTLLHDRRTTQVINTGAGIYLEATDPTQGGSYDNVVSNNIVDDAIHGIVVSNVVNGTTRNTVRGNKVSNNLNVGILFEGSGTIDANEVWNNGKVVFPLSTVYPNSLQSGIHVNYSGTIQITNNHIYDDQAVKTQRYAVYVRAQFPGGLRATLTNNTMLKAQQIIDSLLVRDAIVNSDWKTTNTY